MDYCEIGRKIRMYRKSLNLSQEQLAEKIWISPTHMSHIETGSTKLSLPVLVDIARVLGVSTDDLLGNRCYSTDSCNNEVQSIINSCSPSEATLMVEILKSVKTTIENHKKDTGLI